MCIAGAKNNKHVFVEKPLGVSLSEEIRLRETFRGRDLKFLYGTQQRSSNFGRLAVDLVRNGYIGQVRKVDVWCPVPESKLDIIEPEIPVPEGLDYDLFAGPAEKKPYTKSRCTKLGSYFCHEYSLGFIAGWGAHPLDILQWALNTDHTSPVRYEGSGKTISDRYVFNTTHSWDIHCEYANGIRVRFMSTDVARPVVEGFHQYWSNNGTAFHGSEGILVYSRGACYLKKGDKYMNVSLVKFRPGDVRLEGVNDHLDDLFAAIRENRATVCGLEAAIRSDTISQLSDIVVRTGKSVEWDPGREAMVNGTAEQLAMLKRSVRKPYEV
jgi:predicted dehydrogenase